MGWVKTKVEEMGITPVTGCLVLNHRQLFGGEGSPKRRSSLHCAAHRSKSVHHSVSNVSAVYSGESKLALAWHF